MSKEVKQCEQVVSKYMQDVLLGRIPACEYLKLAVNRHLADFKEGRKRGLNFNPERAYRVIKFLGLLKQSKGKWAGQPLVLEPWQKFIIWVLYGWEKDGVRRFRTAYSEIARKNGKSTLLSGLGLYGLGFDGEGGAEI
jgi:phage terminase large subunit-like protein